MPEMIVLRDALRNPEEYSGWLYLKNAPWTLDSPCFFYLGDKDLDPDEEEKIRQEFDEQGWISTVSSEDIEDAIDNTREQLDAPSEEDLLEAVKFFFENDAFKEW
jgi:hypothetical protein